MRFHRTIASRFVPKGSIKVADKLSDAIAYVYVSRNGKPAAVVYYGKQSSAFLNCYYGTEAARVDTPDSQ